MLNAKQNARTSASLPAPIRLLPDEQAVLRLITEGKSDQEIAQRLDINLRQAQQGVLGVLGKLGVRDRVQGALKALNDCLV